MLNLRTKNEDLIGYFGGIHRPKSRDLL
jgi:hypothetical protein